jgi:ABC-type multidrug transport system fused ATPase/permease subunit
VRVIGLALVGLSLATGATAYLSERASRELQVRTTNRLRQSVQKAWAYAAASLHRRYGSLALFDRTIADTRGIGRFARGTVTEGSAALVRLVYPAAVLVWIDPWMALFPLAATPIHLLFSWLLQRRKSHLQRSFRRHRDGFSGSVRESLEGIESLQGVGAQSRMLARIEHRAARCQRDSRVGGFYQSLSSGSVWALPALALAVSWWMGGSRVLSGEISTGQLVAFAGFTAYLGVPLRRLAQQGNRTRQALKSLQRVKQLLAAAEACSPPGTAALRPAGGGLTVEGLSYSVQERPVFENLSFSFPAGQFIWLRGRSGSGKSTLLRLLAGLEQPEQGTVLLDGQDLWQCASTSVRDTIAFVPQQPFLLNGTVAANLRIGCPEAPEEALREACIRVGLSELLACLPKGLDEVIGTRGVQLSTGEAQRLCIARALLRNPRVLLLDEALSTLDPVSERELMGTLTALAGQVTVVLAAHQLPSCNNIDQIVELEAGGLQPVDLCNELASDTVLPHFESQFTLRS